MWARPTPDCVRLSADVNDHFTVDAVEETNQRLLSHEEFGQAPSGKAMVIERSVIEAAVY